MELGSLVLELFSELRVYIDGNGDVSRLLSSAEQKLLCSEFLHLRKEFSKSIADI